MFLLTLYSLVLLLVPLASAAQRGLIYIPDSPAEDASVWTQPSALAWYYNYMSTPSPQLSTSSLEFVPMMWGIASPSSPSDASFFQSLAASPPQYALAFNEPEMPNSVGGSSISPANAAVAWVANFVPLRRMGVKVGLPATSGADEGTHWLMSFLDECKTLLGGQECEFDFVPVHWYDDVVSLGNYLNARSAL